MLDRNRLLVCTLLLVALFAVPAFAEELKLGIVHTNDHHGHLLPYRAHGEDGWGGVAKRRVAMQRARSDTAYDWLALDGGDVSILRLVGDRVVSFLSCLWTTLARL